MSPVEKAKEVMKGTPLYATICVVVMMITAAVLVLFANPDTAPSLPLVIGLIVTTIPSLIAAIFSERASRDIRNGVVVEKAKEGAAQAIQENQVLTRTGPVVTTELAALARLIELNTAATQTNTAQQQQQETNTERQSDG